MKLGKHIVISATESKAALARKADSCVRCGLCLEHCPTYLLEANESASPRGRIALIGAFAENKIAATEEFVFHLDGCLGCGRCEAECPADVPFMEMIGDIRSLMRGDPGFTSIPKWLDLSLKMPFLLPLAGFLSRLFLRLGGASLMAPFAGKFSGAWRLLAMLPTPPSLFGTRWRARRHHRRRGERKVAIFNTCVASIFDTQTIANSRRLLLAAGYEVAFPRRQRCCGALYRHYGMPRRAQDLREKNKEVFAACDTLISCASGCGRELAASEKVWGLKHADINSILLKANLRFKRWEKGKVVLHTPCTMRNLPAAREAPAKLLGRIPGLDAKMLFLPHGCCGAAGLNTIVHPRAADKMGSAALNSEELRGADILATSNVGCALHLRQLLRRAGRKAEVLHPVTLLERQLID